MKREKVNEARSSRYGFCHDCNEEHDFPEHRGGFFKDGNWNPDSDFNSPFERLLEELAMRRRIHKISPAQMGELILTSQFRESFDLRTLDAWLKEQEWDMWATVPTIRPCEEYIKRAGYGSHTPCVWREGFWIPKHLAKPEDRITPDQARELMALLESKFGKTAFDGPDT